MKFSDIRSLLERNQSPSDWIRIANELADGGNAAFCIEDVHLTIKFAIVWKEKPVMSFNVNYGCTLITWFEIPIASLDVLPTHIDALSVINKYISSAK